MFVHAMIEHLFGHRQECCQFGHEGPRRASQRRLRAVSKSSRLPRPTHACLTRRADALFELSDALLVVEHVSSLPHLSLAPI
jgi:hypothetical protein